MRALVVGLVVVVSGCSTPAPLCSASVCSGCCEATGACSTGDSLAQCGASGAACQSCLPSQSCSSGQCVSAAGGGGGATGGGGGAIGGGGGATGGGGGATDGGCGPGRPVNQAPIAHLTACEPSQLPSDPNCALGSSGSVTFSLNAINPDVITISGVTSTDDQVVAEYRFTLLPPIPGGLSSSALANHAIRTTQSSTTLTIPSGATGTFRIGLQVFDACGLASAMTDVVTVGINP